jgi:hypothetical protein
MLSPNSRCVRRLWAIAVGPLVAAGQNSTAAYCQQLERMTSRASQLDDAIDVQPIDVHINLPG